MFESLMDGNAANWGYALALLVVGFVLMLLAGSGFGWMGDDLAGWERIWEGFFPSTALKYFSANYWVNIIRNN